MVDQWKQSDFNASSGCFYNVHMKEDCDHFAEQWFEKIEFVEQNFHRDFFESWFGNLSPYFLARQ